MKKIEVKNIRIHGNMKAFEGVRKDGSSYFFVAGEFALPTENGTQYHRIAFDKTINRYDAWMLASAPGDTIEFSGTLVVPEQDEPKARLVTPRDGAAPYYKGTLWDPELTNYVPTAKIRLGHNMTSMQLRGIL